MCVVAVCLVAGCESDPAIDDSLTISVEEAKRYGAQFETPAFEPPRRSIEDVVKQFGRYSTPPADCEKKRDEQRRVIRQQTRESGRPSTIQVGSTAEVSVSRYAEHELALGNYANAEALAEAVIPTAYRTDWTILPVLWTQVARARAAMGDTSGAKSAFGSSKAAWIRAAQYDRGRSPFFKALGNASIAQAEGSWRRAERYYRFAADEPIAFWEGTEPVLLRAELAYVLMRQGRLVEAEVEAREAIRIGMWRPGYGAKTARATTRFAEILYEQGRLEEAAVLVGYALNMDEVDCVPPDSVGHAYTLQFQARLLAGQGDWDGVRRQFETIEAQLSDYPGVVERLFHDNPDWAFALIQAGSSEEAISRLDQGLKRARSRFGDASKEYAIRLGYRALAKAAARDRRGARIDFDNAIQRLLWVPGGTRDTESDSRRQRILEGYIRFLQEEIETRGTVSSAELIQEAFRVQTAMGTGPVDRALRSSAVRLAASTADPELADLINRGQRVNERIDASVAVLANAYLAPSDQRDNIAIQRLEREVQELRGAGAALFAEIEKDFPQYSEFVNPKPMTVEGVKSYLRDGETLVLIHTYSDRTLVWGVPRHGKAEFASAPISETEISGRVQAARKSFDSQIRTLADIPVFDASAAFRLYQDILHPIERAWMDADMLLVVANHPLSMLPLTVLPTTARLPAEDTRLLFDGNRQVDWLIRTHNVATLPSPGSLRVLRASEKQAATRKPFVGFGNPIFQPPQQAGASAVVGSYARTGIESRSGSTETVFRSLPGTRSAASAELADLPPLPETADELGGIASALGSSVNDDLYLGKSANEQTINRLSSNGQLATYAVVAFATHGLIAGDLDGLRQPALALTHPVTAGIEGDGLLSMSEILGLRADADWVVLSACNTAAGDGQGADAVSGLGRSFFYAGARGLLVSNWAVHSGATRDLMIDLFRRQSSMAGARGADAYRRAMLNMIDRGSYRDPTGKQIFSYAHPIFWAPFSIVGDGSLGNKQ